MQRQNWRPEEDAQLIELVKALKNDWRAISRTMNEQKFQRSSKACRERFQNQLNPKVSKTKWTTEEEQKLFQLQSKYGNKWTSIAKELPSRTDCIIKNYFYSLVRKVLRRLMKKVIGTKKGMSFDQALGSYVTRTIKPCVLSRIFSLNLESHKSCETKDIQFAQAFQNIIMKYKDFKLAQQIDENDISQIKYIFDALQKLKYFFITKPSETYTQDRTDRSVHSKQKIKRLPILKNRKLGARRNKMCNPNVLQDKILKQIRERKAVFTSTHYPIEKIYQYNLSKKQAPSQSQMVQPLITHQILSESPIQPIPFEQGVYYQIIGQPYSNILAVVQVSFGQYQPQFQSHLQSQFQPQLQSRLQSQFSVNEYLNFQTCPYPSAITSFCMQQDRD